MTQAQTKAVTDYLKRTDWRELGQREEGYWMIVCGAICLYFLFSGDTVKNVIID